MSTLDHLRKRARRWLHAVRTGDPVARAQLERAYPQVPSHPVLRDVQHALARERGYESWVALRRALTSAAPPASPLAALLAAAGTGDATAVAAILDAHPAIIDQRGALPGHTGLRTALHAGSAHEAVVRLLLERGADPNIRDEGDNAFPIHFAAEKGDLAIVRLLVEHGADTVGDGTMHELGVLGWAVCFEPATHLDVARYLLAHGARHTIVTATAMGDAPAIRELAAAGADLDVRMDRTNHRRRPLHLAVVKRQIASLATLIELGADLNAQDAAGLTPIDQAALDDEPEMVRRLVDAGARVSLPAAIVLGRTDDIERLLREDPEILSTTDNRRWARILGRASSRAPGSVVETLLRALMRHRAGLSVVNMEDDPETAVDGVAGYTALHAAAFHGNTPAVEVLLRHGANPRARDRTYCATPAGWAAYAGRKDAAASILEADVDIFDAIDFDRADRIAGILDRDPEALDRPFNAYASCPARAHQSWPAPDCTPIEWAVARKKEQAVRVLTDRGAGRRAGHERRRAQAVVALLQSACWDGDVHGAAAHRMHDRAARRLLARDPSLARDSLYAAIVCGERDEVARRLEADPAAARTPGGARGWTPLLYLAYTRFTHEPTIEHAVAIARMLLDHGADPNDFYMAGDARYTVLVGVVGEGEQQAPRQPYAAALLDLLLSRGAEPFDIQVLYNTHFSGDILWWLEQVYRHTIDTPRGRAWADPDWRMFDMGAYGTGARFLIETAVRTRTVPLAAWVLAHGANPNAAPARDPRFPKSTLYELAVREHLPEIAELLAHHGSPRSEPALDDAERFLAACFRLDGEVAREFLSSHPEWLRSPEPMFAAARRDRPDVLALLLDLGFPVNLADAQGRRTLHEAAFNGALQAAALLIDRGAEVDARDATYDSTPLGWAAHAGHAAMVELLGAHSRDIATLCASGLVRRVRAVLADDPAVVRPSSRDRTTPLFWLPDDEEAAAEVVELLLAAGTDPATRNESGETAADRAERRGMHEIAARLRRAAGT